jgi:hypothetical protein
MAAATVRAALCGNALVRSHPEEYPYNALKSYLSGEADEIDHMKRLAEFTTVDELSREANNRPVQTAAWTRGPATASPLSTSRSEGIPR